MATEDALRALVLEAETLVTGSRDAWARVRGAGAADRPALERAARHIDSALTICRVRLDQQMELLHAQQLRRLDHMNTVLLSERISRCEREIEDLKNKVG
jgi:hypothetical protein